MGASPKGTSKRKALFIQGPTGTGKNALALQAAVKKKGLIINVDSVQVYKGLVIGANSPSQEDLQFVPHALYNVLDPSEPITLGVYKRMAETLVSESNDFENLYFVGGSNFYFRALEKGMPELKEIPGDIKQQVSEWSQISSNEELWQRLKQMDAGSAEKLHPNDRYRVERALTLILSQDKSPADLEAEIPEGSQVLSDFEITKVSLYLERDELKERLEKRVQFMFDQGLVGEVEELLKANGKEASALKTIGYKEVVSLLENEVSEFECQRLIVKNSMYLAKRQMTWLKKDEPRRWFHALKERDQALDFLLSC